MDDREGGEKGSGISVLMARHDDDDDDDDINTEWNTVETKTNNSGIRINQPMSKDISPKHQISNLPKLFGDYMHEKLLPVLLIKYNCNDISNKYIFIHKFYQKKYLQTIFRYFPKLFRFYED